jgi:isoleucyl-tRNA synthetase
LRDDVDNLLEHYDPTTAGRKIEAFVDDLSNWYIRRSRRRFWKSQNDTDKMSAYFTLYKSLVTLSKLAAPFAPFVSEEIYRNLVCTVNPDAPESVHMAAFPDPDNTIVDKDLIEATKTVISVCSLGRAARAKAGIKVRQPLAKVIIKTKSEYENRGIQKLKYQLLDELNVKDIELVSEAVEGENVVAVEDGDLWVAMDTKLSPELEAEGVSRELVRRLQVMRRSAGLEISDHIIIYCQSSDNIRNIIAQYTEYIKQETLATSIVYDNAAEDAFTEKHKLLSSEITLGIKKSS